MYGLPKLDSRGLGAHIIMPVLVALVVVGIGVHLSRSNAATCTSYVYAQGSSGTCVKYIQQLVNWQNKYNTRYGTTQVIVDGAFGPKTKSAVIADQKQFLLTADGIVGPKTWKIICSPQMGPGIPASFPLTAARSAGCNI